MTSRILRVAIYSLLAAVVAMLATLYILYRHTPAWYQPAHYTDDELRAASSDTFAPVARFHDRTAVANADEPVVVELTQEQCNRLIQSLRLFDSRARLPESVSDLAVVFRKDEIILAARVPRMSSRPMSLHLRLVSRDAKLAVSVESVRVGSLPLPQQFVRDQLEEFRQKLNAALSRRAGNRSEPAGGAAGDLLRLGQSFLLAIDAEPMEVEFVTPNASRRVRLDRLELGDGRLRLTFRAAGDPAGSAAPRREFRPEEMRPRPATATTNDD